MTSIRSWAQHPSVERGKKGTYFAVWAPHAAQVHVIGSFNGWDESRDEMKKRGPEASTNCSFREWDAGKCTNS